jgi:hypothetical protein
VDPNDANDIVSIIDAGTVVEPVTIKQLGDATVTTTVNPNKDGTSAFPITWQGRNAGDTADTEADIDADGGAFSVFSPVTCRYWTVRHIHTTHTDKAAGNSGFGETDENYIVFEHCRASQTRVGFSFAGAYGRLINCCSHDNVYGISVPASTVAHDCYCYDNSSYGFYGGSYVRCVAAGNGNGFRVGDASLCVAYGNTGYGFAGAIAGYPWYYRDCIAEANGGWGWNALAANLHTILVRCADYNNTSGRANTGTGNWRDTDAVNGTASFFVDAASADFRLNNNAAGGLLCRQKRSDGLTLLGMSAKSYHDIGAYQHRPPLIVGVG